MIVQNHHQTDNREEEMYKSNNVKSYLSNSHQTIDDFPLTSLDHTGVIQSKNKPKGAITQDGGGGLRETA